MKAAVLFEAQTPLQIEDVDLENPRRGEVKVRIQAAGVCHSDLHYMTGDLQGKLPAVLGHEGVGIVERVGEGVTRVAPGDSVIMTWRPRCGDCEFCTSGRPALCGLGRVQGSTGGLPDGTSRLSLQGQKIHHLMGVSCFAEECVVSERSVVKISPEIPAEVAAIAGCAVVTGVGAALNLMKEATGDAVVVIGAGGVGLSAVMGLNLIGAYPIIAVDTVDARLDLARQVGATHTINSSDRDLGSALAEICPGGPKWAMDAVGIPQTLSQAVEHVGTSGTVVAVGLGRVGASFEVPINALVQQEKRIIGSLYGSSNTLVQLPKILDLYMAGRLPLERLVGESYGLSQINEAYEALRSGAPGRSIILPSYTDEDYLTDGAPRLVESSAAPLTTRSM
jgi:Zn-dependent alcohol dehydrogenase